jgi:hypothetical protein
MHVSAIKEQLEERTPSRSTGGDASVELLAGTSSCGCSFGSQCMLCDRTINWPEPVRNRAHGCLNAPDR